jgi:N4-gp56 family major capsid protein
LTTVLTTNILAGVNVYYDKKFLSRAVNELRVAPFGQKRPLPKGEGKQVTFFRYNNIATSLSNSLLTEGSNPSETTITGQAVTATIKEYGGFSKHSSLVKATHIDRELAGVSELWGENAANVIDLLTQSEIVSNGAYPLRGDLSTTYTYSGTVTTATSTTVFNDSALASVTNYGDTNDDLNQSVIIMTSGASYGQARAVSDYATSGGVITVSPAFDIAPAVGDTFVVASADSTLSAQGLTTTNIRRAVRILRQNRAMTINGYYVGIFSPETEENLMADSTWTNVMQYKDAVGADGLFTGEVGKWGGVRFVSTTQPFRMPSGTIGTAGTTTGGPGATGANYSATGAVFCNLILGQEAFGVTTFSDSGGNLKPGIIVKNPGPQDTSNPLNRFSTVGWVMPFVPKALNPMWAVQIWTTK